MARRFLITTLGLCLVLLPAGTNGRAATDRDQFSAELPGTPPPAAAAAADDDGYTLWKTDGTSYCTESDHQLTITLDADPEDITDLSLIVSAYDVDYTGDPLCEGGPEVDTVTLNSTNLGILRGANDSWSTTRFSVNAASLVQGDNTVYIDTDSTATGCWCVGIGYVALRGRVGEFQVKTVTPKNRAECVDWESPGIAAVFSADVDPATVTSNTFTVTSRWGSTTYDGDLAVDGSTISFDPSPTLPDKGVEVKVTVKGGENGVKAKSGAQLPADYSWTFTTMPKLTVEIIPVQVVDGVNLVHNKPAVVRVRATWDEFSDVTRLPATVSLTYDGSDTYTKNKFVYYIDLDLQSIPKSYIKKGRSANFYSSAGEVPVIADPGSHTIHAVVEPAGQTGDPPKTFEADATVSVNRFWVGYTSQTVNFRTRYLPLSVGGWTAGATQDITSLCTSADNFLRRIYPVARTTPRIDTTVREVSSYYILRVKRILRDLAATNRLGPYNVVVGVVPAAWLSAEVGAVGVQANFVAGITTYSALIADTAGSVVPAHEIGHVFGLEHDPATYSMLGYNLARDIIVDTTASKIFSFAFMDEYISGVGETTVWTTRDAYENLLGELTSAAAAQGVSPAAAATQVVYVAGELSIAGGIESATIDTVDILTADAEIASGSGSYAIELQDETGAMLSSIDFAPDFLDGGDGNQYAPFVAGLAYESGGRKIVIKHGETVIGTVTGSANAPQLAVTSPGAGQSVSGQVNVAWSASDADADTLTFSLLFSADGGTTWDLVDSGITAQSYSLNTAGLPNGAQCRVKVLANDGFNTTEAVSETFSASNACAVLATVPASGATAVPADQHIIIRFRDAMDASSITTDTVALRDASYDAVAGTVAYDSETFEAVFTPAAGLGALTAYTLSVGTSVKNAAGSYLASAYTASFTTAADSAGPGIAYASPPDKSDDAPANALVCVGFDEAMDSASLTADTFGVAASGSAVPGTITYDTPSNTACFTPTSGLSAGSQYTATVTTGAKDASGNAMDADYAWTFAAASGSSAGIRLTGNCGDEAGDLDGDGLWDSLTISAGVEVLTAGTFNLNGRLIDSSGEEIGWATTQSVSLGAGVHLLSLVFDSDEIRSHGVDGPFTLADVQFYDTADTDRYVWVSEACNTYPYDYTLFDATLTLTGLPDIWLTPGEMRDNAFNLNDYAAHKTLADDQLTYTVEINSDARCGVTVDTGDYIDISPDTGWLGYTDVTVKVTGGDAAARDTFRITVANCPEDYPVDCGNGYCCPEDYPYCGTGLRTGKCFAEEPATLCPAERALGTDSHGLSRLRRFRDTTLAGNALGRRLIELYYRHAGSINRAIDRSPALQAASRWLFGGAAVTDGCRQ